MALTSAAIQAKGKSNPSAAGATNKSALFSMQAARTPKQRRELPNEMLKKIVAAMKKHIDPLFSMKDIHAHYMSETMLMRGKSVPSIISSDARAFYFDEQSGMIYFNNAQGIPPALLRKIKEQRAGEVDEEESAEVEAE